MIRHVVCGTAAVLLVLTTGAPPRVAAAGPTPPVIVSEVSATGSSNGTYNADWFELTNTGSTPVDITGWKMDDNSNAFANAVALRGITSIPPGAAVVFVENSTAGVPTAVSLRI